MNKLKTRTICFYILIAVTVAFVWLIGSGILLYIRGIRLTTVPAEFRTVLPAQQRYSDEYTSFPVPGLNKRALCTYGIPLPPSIAARSAVVMDAESGSLLFEKNPDQSIPPASLTKLVAIYTAMQAVEQGKISLKDIITPPPKAWAVNMPPESSLMFLGKNQQVSVEELMLGMSVVSGNDAAVALAVHTAGSVSAFVNRMNETVAALGLHDTHFEDATGLSEKNRTTARDFARFSAVYIRKYPHHLKQFHSVRTLIYPQVHNMMTPQTAVRQSATNTLLDKLEGCDGIKTGFIYESGFNIALTAQRNNTRFIAVILGGAGKNSKEGKAIREKNGKALMDWAFSHFSTVYARNFPLDVPAIPVIGAKERVDRTALLPVLAGLNGSDAAFTIPLSGAGLEQDYAAIHSRLLLPTVLTAPITAGQKVGKVRFLKESGGKEQLLAEFPLVADKTMEKGSDIRWKYDNLALKFFRFVRRFFKEKQGIL